MNDASKKSLCELLGLGVSAVELEKRILWGKKSWKEKRLATKEKWKISEEGSEMERGGEYVRLDATEGSYSCSRVIGREQMSTGWMTSWVSITLLLCTFSSIALEKGG